MNQSKSFQIQTTNPWPLVAGIDISPQSLKYVLLRSGRTGMRVEGFGRHQLQLLEDGGIEHLKQVVASLFRKGSPLHKAKVVVGVEGGGVILKRESFPQLGKKELLQTISFTIQQELGSEDEAGIAVVDYRDLGPDVNQPGHTAYLCVGMAEALVDEQILPFTQHGEIPAKVFPSVAALANLLPLIPRADEPTCVGMLDIGATRSTLIFIKDGHVHFHREITVGGDDFTKAVTGTIFHEGRAIQFDPSEADEFKRRFGYPVGMDDAMTFHGAPLVEVGTMIRPVVERLTGEIQRSIDFYNEKHPGIDISKMYMVGGGAETKHLSTVLQDKIGIAVSVLPIPDPLRVSGGREQQEAFNKHFLELAIAFGLALESAPQCNLLPIGYKKANQQAVIKRTLQYLAVAALAVMSIWSYTINKTLTERRLAVAALESRVTLSARNTGFLHAALEQKQNRLLSQLNDLNARMTQNEVPTQILRMLSHRMPDELALSSVAISNEAPSSPENTKDRDEPVKGSGRALKLSGLALKPPNDVGIFLAQFIVDLEKSGYFSQVTLDKQLMSEEDQEFRFSLTCPLR